MKIKLLLVLIILLGAYVRFYKLDWGQGLFTHPDEYHIVISANQLSFPTQMHPHFFSYGTVTIYLIYFTKLFLHSFGIIDPNLFLIGRFYSALFSTLTIFIIYKIGQFFFNKNYALLASFLVAFTPGLIQQAHFATPESNLTFFLFGSLLFLLNFIKKQQLKWLILASIFFGLALGIKISSAVFAITFLIPILATVKKFSLKPIFLSSLIFITTLTTFFIVAPFNFLDLRGLQNSMAYEGGLAVGKFVVFYTRQFIDTVPMLFQLEKILPFALGPALMLFGLLGFLYLLFFTLKTKNILFFLLLTSFLSLFLSNSFLFAKWTRFLAPTFPFFAIFASYFIFKLNQLKTFRSLFIILESFFLSLVLLWAFAFMQIYVRNDIRISANSWLINNTTPSSTFLVEGGNMIDIPLRAPNRLSLDFYNLDEVQISSSAYNLEQDALAREKIIDALDQSDYFILQSRRVFANHQRQASLFPKTAAFYQKLFAGTLGFKQIKEFTSYPGIDFYGYNLQIPDEGAEETWSVFDHPVIRVFQKNAKLSKDIYAKSFED